MPIKKSLDETLPLFRELAKEGLHVDKKETHKDHAIFDTSLGYRVYNLGPQLKVMAVMFSADASCRMVQTGVKEVPVYEVVCNEQS